jgi:Aspartyl protease
MKCTSSKVQMRLLLPAILAAFALPVLQGEPRCPGNIASVPPRFVQPGLIVVPVKINEKGPFDFMVDTGSQITLVDPSLASELDLKLQGTVGLVSVASYGQATTTVLDRLEADSHVVEKPIAIVQDLGQIRAADPRIRGVLGENFLGHFNLFIDNAHKLVCLDETGAMRDRVRGEHIPLLTSQHPESDLPFIERLVISVHLSATGSRQILLQLDSGSDGPILYSRTKVPIWQNLQQVTAWAVIGRKERLAFSVLPPQDIRIGTRTLRQISFVTPVSVSQNFPTRDEDGLLPTMLFQRVFINLADHYVVFDPR